MSDDDTKVPLPDLENGGDVQVVPDAGTPVPSDSESVNRGAAGLAGVFDVPVQVSAVLGRAHIEVGNLLKLGPGAVLELDRKVGEGADSNDQALAVLRSGRGADLLMVDVALNIRDLVARLDAERIYVPIVACGVTNDARAAVNAIHAGAKEYIPLPPDPDLIAAVLAAVADDTREMIYRDDAMAKVVKLAQQIAGSDASVLITGESGTGKEVLARFVHGRSTRSKRPFITVNCAAIPENLLESELFGHEKGAFTGALARRIGKFEEANGGTLLLDEISEMDVRLQ